MAGIYLHFPFCKKKCHYCNFFSVVTLKQKDVLFSSLLKEIQLQKNYPGEESIDTIYIGGGTPSLLQQSEILKIYNVIIENFRIAENIEFTLEANPDDLSVEKLRMIKDTPVNRLSIGIQSFIDNDLKYLNRIHNAEQSLNALKQSISAGFKNISVDLVYGIPEQTNSLWKKNLEIVTEMDIPHVSAYSLTVEPNTILENKIKKHKAIPPDESASINHFYELMKFMDSKDYIHYEISNFCKDDYHSRHNNNNWFGRKYLGIGPSAHSFNGYERQWNVESISEYIENVKNEIIPFEKETLTPEQKFNEYLMISLRTIKGCDLNYVKQNFGKEYHDHILKGSVKYKESDHLKAIDNKLNLTQEGKLFADRIASDLFITQ